MKVTDEGVPVNSLIRMVKDSVRRAGVSRASDARDLQVTSVQLILRVVVSKTVGGSLDFRVPFIGMKLSAGTKVTRHDTHTIDMTLTPPVQQAAREVRGSDIEDALVDAITTIRETMAGAAEGDDPWILTTGTVDLSFAITATGTISLGVDGELGSEVTQTLRLAIGPC
jgi:Trypsin-co-occurring domain 2